MKKPHVSRWLIVAIVSGSLVCLAALAGGFLLLRPQPAAGQVPSSEGEPAAPSNSGESVSSEDTDDAVSAAEATPVAIENSVEMGMAPQGSGAESGPDFSQDEDHEFSPEELAAIRFAASDPEIGAYLASYPDWHGHAYLEEDVSQGYSVDFYSDAADEWLGYALVDLDAQVVLEAFVPRELSADEFAAGSVAVSDLVFSDGEVLAMLGDPSEWGHELWYNRWEQAWEVFFWRGLDEIVVVVYMDSEGSWIEIWDPAAMSAEEEVEVARNQAIELAYSADGVDQALAGTDSWTTYVEQQDANVWSVSFVDGDTLLFFALVDIGEGRVIQSE
jgi:hypothetical protein